MRALKAIAGARDPLEDGVLLMHCLPFRTVHAYKVVGSLSEKGLISQSGDGGIYLRLTESGRAVVAGRNCSGSAPAPREAVLATEKLVRDKLVHRIPNSECRVVSDAECLDVLLREKPAEELGERRASAFRDVAEFADVVEVLYAISRRAGLSPVDIAAVRLAQPRPEDL